MRRPHRGEPVEALHVPRSRSRRTTPSRRPDTGERCAEPLANDRRLPCVTRARYGHSDVLQRQRHPGTLNAAPINAVFRAGGIAGFKRQSSLVPSDDTLPIDLACLTSPAQGPGSTSGRSALAEPKVGLEGSAVRPAIRCPCSADTPAANAPARRRCKLPCATIRSNAPRSTTPWRRLPPRNRTAVQIRDPCGIGRAPANVEVFEDADQPASANGNK